MDVAPWIRVFGAILDTVPSACYKSFGLRSIKDADVLSEKKIISQPTYSLIFCTDYKLHLVVWL